MDRHQISPDALNFTSAPLLSRKRTISSIGTAARNVFHNRGLGHKLGLEQVQKNTYFGVGTSGKRITQVRPFLDSNKLPELVLNNIKHQQRDYAVERTILRMIQSPWLNQ